MSRVARFAVMACLGLLAVPALASANPGDFDPSWGVGGLIESDPYFADQGTDSLVASQSTGNLLSAVSGSGGIHTVIRRFATDGVETPGFTPTSVPGCGPPLQLVVEPDDSALLLTEGCLVHVLANGGTDSEFGDHGVLPLNRATSFATDSLGRILVASTRGPSRRSVLQRFDSTGEIDPTFADDGTLDLETTFDYDPFQPHFQLRVDKIGVDPSDRILLAGIGGIVSGESAVLARLSPTGARDDSFGSHGTVGAGVSSPYNPRVHGLLLEPSGKIAVLSADDSPSSGGENVVAGDLVQITSSGVHDSSFADDGVLQLRGASGTPDVVTYPRAMTAAPGGGLIVAGAHGYGDSGCCGLGDSMVALVSPSGEFDTSFAGDGIDRFEFEGPDAANDIAVVGSTAYVAGYHAGACCYQSDDFDVRTSFIARLTLAAGAADRDADTVGDSADPCPTVYDPNAQGCPDYTVKPTVELDPRSHHGKRTVRVSVTTDSQACVASPLDLERRKHGKWIRVKTLRSPDPFRFSASVSLEQGGYRLTARSRDAVRVTRGSEHPALADCIGLRRTFSL